MNRHWVDGVDRVAPFGRGARTDSASSDERADGREIMVRLALIDDAEQLREKARLDSPLYQATEKFIDSLYGPTARPIRVPDTRRGH